METLNNPQVGIQPNAENPQVGQPQTDNTQVITTPSVVPEEQYKSLQGDYTKRVEGEITAYEKLVRINPAELKTIEDSRVQNALAKRLYGVDTYAQLIAVYGENFHQTSDDENLDETEKLKRKVNMLEFKAQTETLENWISNYIEQNKVLFSSPESEAKLRDELKFISNELPVKERIRRASLIVFGSEQNPQSQAYKQIAVWAQVSWGNGSPSQVNQEDAQRQIQIDAAMKFLKLK